MTTDPIAEAVSAERARAAAAVREIVERLENEVESWERAGRPSSFARIQALTASECLAAVEGKR